MTYCFGLDDLKSRIRLLLLSSYNQALIICHELQTLVCGLTFIDLLNY